MAHTKAATSGATSQTSRPQSRLEPVADLEGGRPVTRGGGGSSLDTAPQGEGRWREGGAEGEVFEGEEADEDQEGDGSWTQRAQLRAQLMDQEREQRYERERERERENLRVGIEDFVNLYVCVSACMCVHTSLSFVPLLSIPPPPLLPSLSMCVCVCTCNIHACKCT